MITVKGGLRHCYLNLTLIFLNEPNGLIQVYNIINIGHVHLMIQKWIVSDVRRRIFQLNVIGINQLLNLILLE